MAYYAQPHAKSSSSPQLTTLTTESNEEAMNEAANSMTHSKGPGQNQSHLSDSTSTTTYSDGGASSIASLKTTESESDVFLDTPFSKVIECDQSTTSTLDSHQFVDAYEQKELLRLQQERLKKLSKAQKQHLMSDAKKCNWVSKDPSPPSRKHDSQERWNNPITNDGATLRFGSDHALEEQEPDVGIEVDEAIQVGFAVLRALKVSSNFEGDLWPSKRGAKKEDILNHLHSIISPDDKVDDKPANMLRGDFLERGVSQQPRQCGFSKKPIGASRDIDRLSPAQPETTSSLPFAVSDCAPSKPRRRNSQDYEGGHRNLSFPSGIAHQSSAELQLPEESTHTSGEVSLPSLVDIESMTDVYASTKSTVSSNVRCVQHAAKFSQKLSSSTGSSNRWLSNGSQEDPSSLNDPVPIVEKLVEAKSLSAKQNQQSHPKIKSKIKEALRNLPARCFRQSPRPTINSQRQQQIFEKTQSERNFKLKNSTSRQPIKQRSVSNMSSLIEVDPSQQGAVILRSDGSECSTMISSNDNDDSLKGPTLGGARKKMSLQRHLGSLKERLQNSPGRRSRQSPHPSTSSQRQQRMIQKAQSERNLNLKNSTSRQPIKQRSVSNLSSLIEVVPSKQGTEMLQSDGSECSTIISRNENDDSLQGPTLGGARKKTSLQPHLGCLVDPLQNSPGRRLRQSSHPNTNSQRQQQVIKKVQSERNFNLKNSTSRQPIKQRSVSNLSSFMEVVPSQQGTLMLQSGGSECSMMISSYEKDNSLQGPTLGGARKKAMLEPHLSSLVRRGKRPSKVDRSVATSSNLSSSNLSIASLTDYTPKMGGTPSRKTSLDIRPTTPTSRRSQSSANQDRRHRSSTRSSMADIDGRSMRSSRTITDSRRDKSSTQTSHRSNGNGVAGSRDRAKTPARQRSSSREVRRDPSSTSSSLPIGTPSNDGRSSIKPRKARSLIPSMSDDPMEKSFNNLRVDSNVQLTVSRRRMPSKNMKLWRSLGTISASSESDILPGFESPRRPFSASSRKLSLDGSILRNHVLPELIYSQPLLSPPSPSLYQTPRTQTKPTVNVKSPIKLSPSARDTRTYFGGGSDLRPPSPLVKHKRSKSIQLPSVAPISVDAAVACMDWRSQSSSNLSLSASVQGKKSSKKRSQSKKTPATPVDRSVAPQKKKPCHKEAVSTM